MPCADVPPSAPPHLSCSCGAQKNMSLYYELFNQSGRPLAIENCHQGLNFTDGGNPDQMGPGWCPYNWFRTSGDTVNLWDRVISNLMTVAPFLQPPKAAPKGAAPLSRPGCWAYPDMLEVGSPPRTRPHAPCPPPLPPLPHPLHPAHPAPCRTPPRTVPHPTPHPVAPRAGRRWGGCPSTTTPSRARTSRRGRW